MDELCVADRLTRWGEGWMMEGVSGSGRWLRDEDATELFDRGEWWAAEMDG